MVETALPFVAYGRQAIDESDVAAVVAALTSDWLTQGPAVEHFETALSALTGAAYGVAVANATAALHIACLALGVGPGDRVWTSPNSFVASANCALQCGAIADFVDIDRQSWNMSVAALEAKLVTAERTGTLPKVVIPVHFGGTSCDMAAIAALAVRYGFRVIEDASHAIGGSYLGARIGACTHSDMCVFSFHPVKIVTTGEGGAVMTQDPALAVRLRELRSHGITRDPARMTGPSEGAWYYQQVALGLNYRMTDLQAALGSSQLKRIDDFIARRHAIADAYDTRLAGLPLATTHRPRDGHSAMHLYCIRLDVPAKRSAVFDALRAAQIGVNVHYIPIHLQPWYRAMGFAPGDFPEAERYYAGALTLPMHPQLSAADVDRVVDVLTSALG